MEADREDMSVPANWNAKNLARITGRTIVDTILEHRHPKETCDLVNAVRKWRMKWVGHILRNSFLARKMLMRMQKPYEEGSILLMHRNTQPAPHAAKCAPTPGRAAS